MTDKPSGSDTQPNTPSTLPASWGQELSDWPEHAREYAKRLRDEAAANRKRVEELERLRAEAETAQLAEQGRWRELAEQRQAELDALKPRLEVADRVTAETKTRNDKRIEALPPALKALVPDGDPAKVAQWLDALDQALPNPAAFSLDAGNQGGGGAKPVRLTDQERAVAQRFGMTDDEYAKYKAERGQAPNLS